MPSTSQDKYPGQLRQILNVIHEEIRKQTTLAAAQMKKRYDQKSTLTPFKEGDTVWYYSIIRKKGKTTKLTTPWHGPYIVTYKLNDYVVRIQDAMTEKFFIVHVDKLAAYAKPRNPIKSAWLTVLSP